MSEFDHCENVLVWTQQCSTIINPLILSFKGHGAKSTLGFHPHTNWAVHESEAVVSLGPQHSLFWFVLRAQTATRHLAKAYTYPTLSSPQYALSAPQFCPEGPWTEINSRDPSPRKSGSWRVWRIGESGPQNSLFWVVPSAYTRGTSQNCSLTHFHHA